MKVLIIIGNSRMISQLECLDKIKSKLIAFNVCMKPNVPSCVQCKLVCEKYDYLYF